MDKIVENLRAVVGRGHVRSEPDELLVYECDGLTQHKHLPRAVVFPGSTEEVAAVVRVLARAGVSFAPRGAGTGLSGGALAVNRGVVIEMARMRRVLSIDAEDRLARVEAGVVNAQVSRAAAPHGLYYAPDPSSGTTCTVGGNIAENAGGIHCLKYGVTTDHVRAARVVLADGRAVELGGAGESAGYDLLGVFVGSEGTFGVVTEATVRLLPLPQAVRTLLADFADVDEASRAVSAIIAAGLIPAGLEMVDGATIRAVEASVFAAGLPLDAGAALLIELDGLEAGLDEEAARAEAICREHGARGVRRARDERERKKLWAARKGAFGAMGRLAPDMMIQDAVVPRSRLPEVLAETYRISAKYGLQLANVFHAGDGNLHPFISFDRRDGAELRRVEEAGREIMETCVRAGGTITGEHGVGLDKSAYLPLIFSADDLEVMLRVRAAFDPTGLCNPGKIIPAPPGCGEARAAAPRPANSFTDDLSASRPPRNFDHTSKTFDQTPKSFGRTSDSFDHTPKSSDQKSAGAASFEPGSLARALGRLVGEATVTERGGGVTVSPGSADEAREVVRLAAGAGARVVPEGAGLWPGARGTFSSRVDAGRLVHDADSLVFNDGNVVHDADKLGHDAGDLVHVSTRRMSRVLRHEPADLVATVEAGVSLETLNAELGRAGQWLPLDPPGDGRATVGGIVAAGLGGAQSLAYGPPRGFVLGMRVVLADGRAVKAGGSVVKNVAGYDLCKLFAGSRGTLGLVTELTLRLRPRPEREATLVARADARAPLLAAARALLAAEFLPAAVELLSPRAAQFLQQRADESSPTNKYSSTNEPSSTNESSPTSESQRANKSSPANESSFTDESFALLVRFAGTEKGVASQVLRARDLLGRESARAAVEVLGDDSWTWRALASLPASDESGLRWRANVRPSALSGLLAKVERRVGPLGAAAWHAGLGLGRLRVMHEEVADWDGCAELLAELRGDAHGGGGSLEIEAAGAGALQALAARAFDARAFPEDTAELMRRVKDRLDPRGLFPSLIQDRKQ